MVGSLQRRLRIICTSGGCGIGLVYYDNILYVAYQAQFDMIVCLPHGSLFYVLVRDDYIQIANCLSRSRVVWPSSYSA